MTAKRFVHKQETHSTTIRPVDMSSKQSRFSGRSHLGSPPASSKNWSLRDRSPGTTSMMSQSTSSASSTSLTSPITMTSSISSYLDPLQKNVDQASLEHLHALGSSSRSELVQRLLISYGHASHMGFQDPSYRIYSNEAGDGAIIYKILDRTAVISGDPLCPLDLTGSFLQEFRHMCKQNGHKVAIVGASDRLARLAQRENCITMQFGTERVINPATNPLLTGRSGKRTIQKCRQLLKSGIAVETYDPSLQYDAGIEANITRIYDDWRAIRNESHTCQAYVTVFDLFVLSDIMTYLVVRDKQREIIGFAALRRYENESHLDPVIASPRAPSGTVDLLMVASFTLARDAGYTHLSLGFEPLRELKDITGMPGFITKGMRAVHKHILAKLPLNGKQAFYQRFHPDKEQDGALHIIFFQQPKLRTALAMLHFANVDVHLVVRSSSAHLKQRIASKGRKMRLGSRK